MAARIIIVAKAAPINCNDPLLFINNCASSCVLTVAKELYTVYSVKKL